MTTRPVSRRRFQRRLRAGVAVTLLVGVGMVSGCASDAAEKPSPVHATQHPALQQLRGHLLYETAADGDVQALWSADRHGSRRLTAPGRYCCLLRISPDRKQLLVMPGGDPGTPVTGGTLAMPNLAYTRLPLTDATLNLIPQAWSSDGARIAFEGWDDNNPARTGIYIARAKDGRHLTRVTTRPGAPHDLPLDFSPDGRRLVFYRQVNADSGPSDIGGSLWVVNVDGTKPHPVTSSTPAAPWARWSPDGTRILFASERLQPHGAIFTVQPDGKHLTSLYRDPAGRFPLAPAWSPDGTQIVVALDPTNDAFTHPANQVYVMTANGRSPRLLLDTHDFKRDFEWYA